jgi:predicted DNA-binding transcriptional regulator YafY
LKLLADAVSSSRFLTEKKSSELIKKLEKLTSKYEAKQIQRQVFIADRVKSINERIYVNVDTIHKAIAEGKKISFKYFDYNIRKRKHYRDGEHICSPYSLTWENERYYLVAFYQKYSDSFTNFRVDRMENVTLLDEDSDKLSKKFNLSEYLNSTFSMFSGEAENVKLKFDNSLINAVLDRFGKSVSIHSECDEHFTVSVKIKTNRPEPFFGWLFQFGTKAEIIEPIELKQKYIKMLQDVIANQK